ncbi:hypothetical protein WAI453_013377 [Rhynchosporium graminicola]
MRRDEVRFKTIYLGESPDMIHTTRFFGDQFSGSELDARESMSNSPEPNPPYCGVSTIGNNFHCLIDYVLY